VEPICPVWELEQNWRFYVQIIDFMQISGCPKAQKKIPKSEKKSKPSMEKLSAGGDSLTIVKREVPVHTFGGLHYRNPKKPILCLF